MDQLPNNVGTIIPFESLNCRPTPEQRSRIRFSFMPPREHHVAFHFPSPWYHGTRVPWSFDALIRPRPVFRTHMFRQKTNFLPTKGYRYKLEVEPSGGGIQATCLAEFTFPECGDILPLVNQSGTFEFGFASGNLVKGYRAHGAYKWRCYLSSLTPGPTEDRMGEQVADHSDFRSADIKLTPISKTIHTQMMSCWVCPASGRSVRTIRDGNVLTLYICDYL